MVDLQAPKAFVTGWPVSHSRSPIIHSFWLGQLGLAGSYEIRPCEADALPAFLRNMAQEGFVGGNVTIPHKEAALDCVDVVHPAAQAIGAVNTVWLEDGRLHGDNTDAYGFLANLDEHAPGWDGPEARAKIALVIGAGGAARAIIYGLITREFQTILVANRTRERAEALCSFFGETCQAIDLSEAQVAVGKASIIVNTTALGMKGDDPLPVALDCLNPDTLVTDIVYTPLETCLLAAAKTAGCRTVDGLGMLLHQAVPGFAHWFGARPVVSDELRQTVLVSLGEET